MTSLICLNLLTWSPPPQTISQNMNSHVIVATTSWWTPQLWPAATTSAATAWLCGGSPHTRMNVQNAERSGKAFLKSTYCWGMCFTAAPYQWKNVWFSDHSIHMSLWCTVRDRDLLNKHVCAENVDSGLYAKYRVIIFLEIRRMLNQCQAKRLFLPASPPSFFGTVLRNMLQLTLCSVCEDIQASPPTVIKNLIDFPFSYVNKANLCVLT